MTHFFSRMTALALSGFGVSSLWAADVSFSGFFDGDVAGYYKADTTDKNMAYQANHELDLTATVKLNEKVSVDIYATSYSWVDGSAGGTVPAKGADPAARWTGFAYDGFVASTAISPDMMFKFGDLTYSSGQFNYYNYKRTNNYAVNMKDRGFRGAEIDVAGLSLAAGADTKYGYGAYAAYALEVSGSTVKPFFSYAADQAEDSYAVRGGLDGTLAIDNHKIKLAGGVLKDKGSELSSTVAIEPILAFGSVSLAATAFVAILDDENPTEISVPERMFFYVEPGYALTPKFSVGLPLEYHTMSLSSDVSLDEVWAVPTAYFALADGFNFSVWAQGSLRTGSDIENKDPYFGLGSEAIVTF